LENIQPESGKSYRNFLDNKGQQLFSMLNNNLIASKHLQKQK